MAVGYRWLPTYASVGVENELRNAEGLVLIGEQPDGGDNHYSLTTKTVTRLIRMESNSTQLFMQGQSSILELWLGIAMFIPLIGCRCAVSLNRKR